MHIVDGAWHAGELREDIKVEEVKPLRGGMTLVTFVVSRRRHFGKPTKQATRKSRRRAVGFGVFKGARGGAAQR